MGLLAKITAEDYNKSRPLSFSNENFCSFLERNKIEFLLYLCQKDQNYFCRQSYGLDSLSIIKAVSTKTFWEGFFSASGTDDICKLVELNKDDGSLIQLLQFFSDSQKDLIESASLIRFSDSSILALFNRKMTPAIIDGFEKYKDKVPLSSGKKILKSGEYTSSFSIDFSQCRDSFLAMAKKEAALFLDEIEKAFMTEIYERLYFSFGAGNFIYMEDKSRINVKMSSSEKIPSELIFRHLVKTFSPLLGADSRLIHIDFGEE